MSVFLELTHIGGKKRIFNVVYITEVVPYEECTEVKLHGEPLSFTAKESYEEIRKWLEPVNVSSGEDVGANATGHPLASKGE